MKVTVLLKDELESQFEAVGVRAEFKDADGGVYVVDIGHNEGDTIDVVMTYPDGTRNALESVIVE